MSKRYREAFKETMCHCRRKRTLNLRHSSVHLSYYSSAKSNRHAPGVSIIRRQDAITCDRNVVRSDTQQTQFCLSANGQGSVDNEQTEPVMDNYLDTSFELSTDQLHKDGHKSWTESRQKSLCCSSCTDEHEPTPPSSYERHGLLIHAGSADSAC